MEGEKKVDADGKLLDGREYDFPVFTCLLDIQLDCTPCPLPYHVYSVIVIVVVCSYLILVYIVFHQHNRNEIIWWNGIDSTAITFTSH
ncbi:hypothetical protein BDF22DRAFT_331002 [Syncephalis plumigaleata]|nr:hypothetical protein BDF22DRAFT_331002 [Syncephalis plumigaleata]